MTVTTDPEFAREPLREKRSFRRRLLPGFDDRPPFMLWLRLCWLDVLTQLLCLLAAFLIYTFVPPVMPRYFPLYTGIERSPWGLQHGHPYLSEYITTTVSAVVSFAVPAAIMGTIGLWHIMGLGYALATATLFQSLIKVFIGGLRPHFLAVCAPPIPPVTPGLSSLGPRTNTNIYYTPTICTGPASRVTEAQMSFPSGHACAAFAGFGFLALYLNAKFQCFGHGARGRHWKLVLFSLPWCVAVVIAGSKVRDRWHHPVDVVVGALVGTLFAHVAFGMVFRGVYGAGGNALPKE
ncbi:PAP2-domain-containing protein [Dothidotthia symphoricarpi CBS 119687]|uniref:PAP2-domain-containing protein n=1 Tax=Dothidotthia symphoricarpi CBS 119687 TaxID=1392245 RepID=A0A6A5ZYD9_9PLEO|nr:PAP2-domain-containing protein [Dothidotthia symphoricarpi CBS 119687]KAF2124762.1 PAP2-domain-containing protein [Dothidotthia symphoricarpi CBS 119687]